MYISKIDHIRYFYIKTELTDNFTREIEKLQNIKIEDIKFALYICICVYIYRYIKSLI
jgi:hypothetical protein